MSRPDPTGKGASATYRPKGYGVSPSLQRARKPFRFGNALIGGSVALFALGVYTYSISSVKQDDFSDVADLLPPEAERGNLRTIEDEARDALAAKGIRNQRSPEGAAGTNAGSAKTAAFQSVASVMPSRPSTGAQAPPRAVYQPSSPSTLSKPLPDAVGGAINDAEATARDAAARVKGAAHDAEAKAEGVWGRLVGAIKSATGSSTAPVAGGLASTPGPRDAGPGAALVDAEAGLTGLERDVDPAVSADARRAAAQVERGADALKQKGNEAASAVGNAFDTLKQKSSEAASEARDAFDSAKSRASSAAADARDSLHDLENRAQNGIERFGNRAEQELNRLGNQAQDGLQRAERSAKDGLNRAESAARDGYQRAERTAKDGLQRAESGLDRAGRKVQSGWEAFEARAEDTARQVKHEASKAGDVPVQEKYYLPGRLSELAFARNRGLVDNRGNLFVWGAPNVDKVGTVSDRENFYGKRLV